MNQLVKMIEEENDRLHFWTSSDNVLLAVSGGVDSMALLDAFSKIANEVRPFFSVLHVQHHLRPEADKDCELVKGFCDAREIPFYVKHWDSTVHPKSNVEAAARTFRYQFFQEKMQELEATVILTAHHADDQMETILMRLARGSTLQGIAGIKKERAFGPGKLIRPLLDIPKEELYVYCEDEEVHYLEDHTNVEDEFTRNRFRNQITPLIKKENSKASIHFNEFSQDMQDLLEVSLPVIQKEYRRCFERQGDIWLLNVPIFLSLSASIRRLLIGYFLQEVWAPMGVSFRRSHLIDIMKMAEGTTPQTSFNVSGGKVQRSYESIYFKINTMKNQQQDEKYDSLVSYSAEMIQNQWLELPINGKIGLFSRNRDEFLRCSSQVEQVRVDEKVLYPLFARFWQPGDRIRLNKEAPFTKKISRIFIDQKVPQQQRKEAVIVTDVNNNILWIPGYAQSIWVYKGMEQQLFENENSQKKEKRIVYKNNEVTE